ncbi:MAG: LysR family transcriptional regulator [Deltaproteobacteria bacterium]|nr:LysR family transcriptional regulator [Deltaproteobacteria bacterium]
MDTAKLTAFVAAAEAGSLSRAAERLGAQLSTVSRQITDLEGTLGVPLFVRTGRGVLPTPAGERFLERARHVLRELEVAAAEARGSSSRDIEELRLSAPPDLSHRLLPAALAELARRHPRLSIEARTDTRRVSLVEEAYDAVLRLGPLEPSDLLARRLGTVTPVLCAAPSVVVGRLRELARLEHVLAVGVRSEVSGTVRGRAVRVRCEGPIRVSTFGEAAELAARSGRIVIVPSFVAAPMITSGRLHRIARELSFGPVEVHLLRTARHRGSAVLEDLGDLVAASLDEAERVVGAARSPERTGRRGRSHST